MPHQKVAASLPAMLREAYEAVAPEPGNWPLLVHRVFELAATFEGWDEAQLRRITSPLLVMVGDRDVVTAEHAIWLSRLCPHGQLCVLPRTDHLAPISRADWVDPILRDFLGADLDAPLRMDAAHG